MLIVGIWLVIVVIFELNFWLMVVVVLFYVGMFLIVGSNVMVVVLDKFL